MKLRDWQQTCLDQALAHYACGNSHFLCLATPGAGKTLLASTLASRLLDQGLVDLVICFAPSVIVAEDFQHALSVQTGARFDGRLGARGTTITYQSMQTQPEAFWSLFQDQRVFAIFDEIHHCAGHTLEGANAWGADLISRIQQHAVYTLALTGTPWRSDRRPITLACYGDEHVTCDYQYGLGRAIDDGVCRTPQLTLIDNNDITVQRGSELQRYRGLESLLADEACRYDEVLRSDSLITYTLTKAMQQLDRIRRQDITAGGLIVASSVDHAHQIAHLMATTLGEHAALATYQERDPLSIIRRFASSHAKWIISVGMISEGTNVPRLRVCCHLTRVKTELYFRQVLGRILRNPIGLKQQAYFYMPAEPTLIEYAERLVEDIPTCQPVIVDTQSTTFVVALGHISPPDGPSTGVPSSPPAHVQFTESSPVRQTEESSHSPLAIQYESRVEWSVHFRSQVLAIHGLSPS